MAQKAAHVISDRQKRGALSTVVKKAKPPKNVLVRNEIDFWPSLDANDCETFEKLLETYFSEPEQLKHLSIGLESTLRNLKKPGEVRVLVIANEISPKWFGKHLIAMAIHKNPNLRIIIVPSLKDITRKVLKVSAILFVMRQSESATIFESFYDKLDIHQQILKHYYTVQPSTDVTIKRKKKVKKQADSGPPVELLKVSSDSSRAFVPDEAMEVDVDVKSLKIESSSDFISFSKNSDSALSFLDSSPVPLYRPIKIKKINGNPNRKKT